MTKVAAAREITWIPIERIQVINPRLRNQSTFREIVENIAKIGLKRPITVTGRGIGDGSEYDLVCGQGRLEAYQMLGQQNVPALIVDADPEDCLIASLVENCARRQHSAIDLLQDIGAMQERGHSVTEIAAKTGLTREYVNGVTRLLRQGEHRLLSAVESRVMPLSVAVEIAEADDPGVQRALHTAYEKGLLRGKKLLAAKRLIEMRKRRGKAFGKGAAKAGSRMTSAQLIKAYEEDVAKKRELIARSYRSRDKLLLITEALSRLSRDEGFLALLEDEGLTTLPASVSARLNECAPS